MRVEAAKRLNAASAMLALYLDGCCGVSQADVDLVRGATLAQLQTAKEVIEAHNADMQVGLRPDGLKTIWCVCADPLLVRVKAWADRQSP